MYLFLKMPKINDFVVSVHLENYIHFFPTRGNKPMTRVSKMTRKENLSYKQK